jgi:CRISPR/Cas system-associated exonuclease Cas4 (RecB family)
METVTETGTAATRERAQEGAGGSAPVPAQEIFVTVSDALEYLFCPRFIFFERCLMIPEHQEKKYKVLKDYIDRTQMHDQEIKWQLKLYGKGISSRIKGLI